MRHQRRGARVPRSRYPRARQNDWRGDAVAGVGRQVSMIVLFWDIDGTLLTTAKAGVFAWEDAVRELTGRGFELAKVRIAGLTDYQIAVKTFESMGIEPDDAFLRRFVDRYGELLPASLPRKQGRVLPNVREILRSEEHTSEL